jgi:uncharacterized membrane protein
LARLRNSFLTGLIVILPIGVTIWLILLVIGWIDAFVVPWVPDRLQPGQLLHPWLGSDPDLRIRGFGVVIFLGFTVLVGWIAKGMIGRSILRTAESVVDRMPVVRSVYNGLKQIAETVFTKSEASFQKVCIVEYPRRGTWTIGFVATEAKGELQAKVPGASRIVTVFMATTPNPTTGFLFYVEESDIRYLDMSIEDAAKLIISAGLVGPPAAPAGAVPAAAPVPPAG